VKRQPFKDNCY